MTRDNKVFSIQVTVTLTLKTMSHPPALSDSLIGPCRTPNDAIGSLVPKAKSSFSLWLIGSLWLRGRSWRWGRMKRENSFMVNGVGRVAGRGEVVGWWWLGWLTLSKCQMLFLSSLWCLTGSWDGFSLATAKTQKQDGDRGRWTFAETHHCKCWCTNTHPRTHIHTRLFTTLCKSQTNLHDFVVQIGKFLRKVSLFYLLLVNLKNKLR